MQAAQWIDGNDRIMLTSFGSAASASASAAGAAEQAGQAEVGGRIARVMAQLST
jgi:hypothetical protein